MFPYPLLILLNFLPISFLEGKVLLFLEMMLDYSLLNVKEPSSLIISFRFENLPYPFFNSQFSLVTKCDISKMANQLVRLDHTYFRGALTIKKDVSGRHLSDVISVVIHPCLHHHIVTKCR